MYVNCGQRNEYGSDLRCNDHYLSSTENMARKADLVRMILARFETSVGTKHLITKQMTSMASKCE